MTSPEATIRRGVRNARYASIPNRVFEDTSLSMEARWLLCYLLSKPDNWIARIRDIRNVGKCGRDKATAMVNELIAAGYAEREQLRDDGKFGSSVLVVYDEPREMQAVESHPVDDNVASLPQTDLPATVPPDTVLPGPVNPTPSKDLEIAKTDSNLERERASEDRIRAEERPGTAAFQKRVQRLIHGDGYSMGEWPNWNKSSPGWIETQFANLTDDERKQAEADRDAMIAKSSGKKSKIMPLGIFLRDKAWSMLTEADRKLVRGIVARREAATTRPDGWAPAYGPVHAAKLFDILLAGPQNPSAAPRSGPWLASHIRAAWPRLAAFHQVTVQHGGMVLAGLGAERMEFVPAEGDLMAAWQDEFRRRNWPWLTVPDGMRGLYMPKGGPYELENFERRIGHEHAA